MRATTLFVSSLHLVVEAWLDPRGEVLVKLSQLGDEDPYATWTCSGMVGRASVPRLLELAAEQLRGEDALLNADAASFERLAARQRQLAQQWTAYYAGTGPRPETGKLP